MIASREINEDDIAASLIRFGEEILSYSFYGWQDDTITPFDDASARLVMVSLCTPNGSGKSSVVIPTVALGWLALYKRGRVVITTKDGKQLDNQVLPAIMAHRSKFPHWKFIEREVHTPDEHGNFDGGGHLIAFVTDDAGRAEGWHKLDDFDGPLLIICDESKSIPETIFEAIDRCTYNAILLTSSPGFMKGRFYQSQYTLPGWVRVRVGLNDCPHIPPDKIQRLMDTYGPNGVTPNPQFLKSTLEGQFMEAAAEARFNAGGLKAMADEAAEFERRWRIRARERPADSIIGELYDQPSGGIQWMPDIDAGWVWIREAPVYGCEYIGWGDPMTGEQSEGSLKRDTHAFGILRTAYIDQQKVFHPDEIVAILYAPHEGVRWDNDIVSERFDILLRYYGDCCAVVEANNSGVEVLRLLKMAGRNLWLRPKHDHRNPGRRLEVMGFQTNAATKNLWIGAIGRAIRENEPIEGAEPSPTRLICLYPLAVSQFSTFILNEKGVGEAQEGCFDDFVAGIGMGLFAKDSATKLIERPVNTLLAPVVRGAWL